MGLGVTADGSRVYIASGGSFIVTEIDTATDTVVATLNIGTYPFGLAIHPDGDRIYVTNPDADTVTIVDTATFTVSGAPIAVGDLPFAFGLFIAPALPEGCPSCGDGKVSICHKPGKKPKTLCIGESSAPDHLAHGDTCGACP